MKKSLVLACFTLLSLRFWAQPDTSMFSVPGGFYDEIFALELKCHDPQYHIRYTTNGSDPTAQSPRYTKPLVLDERMYSSSNIYQIRNCPEDQFFVPKHIDRCIVIRAALFDDDGQCWSEVYTNSYFIKALGCDLHGLPAVSLCVDSLDLFDYNKGIFVPGAYYHPEAPKWTGNYYQRGVAWERRANFEFYEYDNTGVNQQCGVRTHGGNGRRFHQKTLKVYARDRYGKKHFKHRFFTNIPEHVFNTLVLRPFHSSNAGCEDYICNRLAQQLNLDFMADRPAVMFINGEYWGIYYVKEKPDEHYVEDHYGIESDSVNLFWRWQGEVENGQPDRFLAFRQWLADADLSEPKQYAYACSQIDIDNFIDYILLELFVANFDWPANNVRFWQSGDSPFRWMFYDGDSSLENTEFDVFANATYEGADSYPTCDDCTLLFRKLLQSQKFQEQFARRFNQLIISVFSYKHTQSVLETIKNELKVEVQRQFQRFDPPEEFYPCNYGVWLEGHMKQTLDFLRERPRSRFLSMPRPEVKAMKRGRIGHLDCLQVESGNFGSDVLKIMDLKGKTVYLQTCVLAKGKNYVPLNVRLPQGVYRVTLGDSVRKLMVWR